MSTNRLQEASTVLNYWLLLNSLTQSDVSNLLSKVKDHNIEEGKLRALYANPVACILSILQERKNQECSYKYSGLISLYGGKINRQKCIKNLADKLIVRQPEDCADDVIALFSINLMAHEDGFLTINKKQQKRFLVISPIIWILYLILNYPDKPISELIDKESYENQCDKIQEAYLKSLGTRKVGNEEVPVVEDENINKLYISLVYKFINGKDGINTHLEKIDQIDISKGFDYDGTGFLVDSNFYETNSEINELYITDINTPAGFQMDFFSDDLKYLIDNLGSLEEAKQNQLLDFILSIKERDLYKSSDSGQRTIVLPKRNELDVDYYKFLCDSFSVKNEPLGTWPNGFSLSTMQQFAVNKSVAMENDTIFSVNGPPGTGKTTLLREVVADSVVKKALVLLFGNEWKSALEKKSLEYLDGFDNPDCYFGRNGYLKEDFIAVNNYSILVASSNNGAVENITRELPVLESICSEETNKVVRSLFVCNDSKKFFKDKADTLFGEECWGLVSVPLGKTDNLENFKKILRNEIEEDDSEQEPEFKKRKDIFFNSIKQLMEYRNSYTAKENERNRLFDRAREEIKRISPEQYEEQYKDANSNLIRFEELFSKEKPAYKTKLENENDEKYELLVSLINTHIKESREKLNWFSALFKKERFVEICNDIRRSKSALKTINFVRFCRYVEKEGMMDLSFMNGLVFRKLESHRDAPVWDDGYQFAKQKAFADAMGLLESFVRESSVLSQTLNSLPTRLTFPHVRLSTRKYQTALMLLTPVVSSTFASVNTLFKRFDLSTKDAVDSFGYLIIDEAGQAIPYSALGAILRAKKTIVVGDPLQIEPVVADDLKILKERVYKDPILARYTKQEENNQEWSVQSCADLINPYGIYNKGYGWIGSPLIVHRRCIDPMFTISNMLSYDGMMINPNSDEKSQDSRWIDVSEINMDPGYKHYNIAQEDVLVKLVGSLVRELGPEPDIYIISPFKDIGEALTKRIRDGVVCKDSDAVPYLEKIIVENKADEKKKKRIGTVHTFQGKDSKIVILLLGCERKMHKSIEWVKKSILNVAMTRAEKRIYVIGDWEAWSKYNPSIRDNKELFSSLVKSS